MRDRSHAGIDNYGYINARVRAMKSLLLNRDFYEELIHAQSFASQVGLLEKSPYRTEIDECAISRSEMEGVDEALKRNLSRSFRRILNFTAGEPHDLILFMLGRWDLHNIITLLRGVHIKVPPEQIFESLIPAGELEAPLLNQLSQQKSIREVIDLLATWGSPYAKALNEKYRKYIEQNNLSLLELSLYKVYYQHVINVIKGGGYNYKILEDLISHEVDAINVTTILRLQQMNVEDLMQRRGQESGSYDKEDVAEGIEEYFVHGGREIRKDKFVKLCLTMNVENVLNELETTPFGAILKKVHQRFMEQNSISILERKLEEMVIKRGASIYSRDPLSIGTPIGYIWRKYNEVVNLRIIMRCKKVGMPETKIREELVLI